jgi:hypothetical protein
MDMSFQKLFLRDFTGRKLDLGLALFGKHPAWDDHMDDLGMATDSLRMCKRLLYLEGIAANAARQQSLSADQAAGLLPYRHFLLWSRAGEMILLRLVESQDGRGRGYFPLVAAVHFATANPQQSLAAILTALRTFTDQCRSLTDRDEVRRLHHHAREDMQASFRQFEPLNGAQESATPGEVAAMQSAATGGSFVRAGIPVTRYELSKSFGVLTCFFPDQPLLLSQFDGDSEINACLGQPAKGDFWFLRAGRIH